jgi:hypothetical protein
MPGLTLKPLEAAHTIAFEVEMERLAVHDVEAPAIACGGAGTSRPLHGPRSFGLDTFA